MSYKIISTKQFEKDLKYLSRKYPSLISDVRDLAEILSQNPTMGTPLGFDCYKIRIKITSKGKGKSGGGRLITYIKTEGKKIYLVTLYDKSEQETINDKKLVYYLKLSGLL